MHKREREDTAAHAQAFKRGRILHDQEPVQIPENQERQGNEQPDITLRQFEICRSCGVERVIHAGKSCCALGLFCPNNQSFACLERYLDMRHVQTHSSLRQR
jgi:hypothetical protein